MGDAAGLPRGGEVSGSGGPEPGRARRDEASVPAQLCLPLRIPGSAALANFLPGPNGLVLRLARLVAAADGDQFLYLWGEGSTGKSHLLQAMCRESAAKGRRVGYVPLARNEWLAPAVLDDLDGLDLLCIDDLDAIAGGMEWEEALFHLYNRAREVGGRIVFSARTAPGSLPLALADLRSRLTACLITRVRPLNDADRVQVLRGRARERGIELPAPAAWYLVRRVPRDMHSLMAILERIDTASLQAQRSVTVPFVRGLLAANPPLRQAES